MPQQQQLDEIAQLVGQLRLSITASAATVPGNSALSAAIEQLGQLTDKAAPYAELAATLRQDRVVLSPRFAESMDSLLEQARHSVARRAQEYQPNQIPAAERWNNFFSASALLAYGAVSTYLDDFFLPGKRGNGIHLHGLPVVVMFAAVICATLVLTLTIVDHYDRRDNERHYQITAKYLRLTGWILAGVAVLLHLGGTLGLMEPMR